MTWCPEWAGRSDPLLSPPGAYLRHWARGGKQTCLRRWLQWAPARRTRSQSPQQPWTFPGGHGRGKLHVRPGTRPVRKSFRTVCAGSGKRSSGRKSGQGASSQAVGAPGVAQAHGPSCGPGAASWDRAGPGAQPRLCCHLPTEPAQGRLRPSRRVRLFCMTCSRKLSQESL